MVCCWCGLVGWIDETMHWLVGAFTYTPVTTTTCTRIQTNTLPHQSHTPVSITTTHTDTYLGVVGRDLEEPVLCQVHHRALFIFICIHRFMSGWDGSGMFIFVHKRRYMWLIGERDGPGLVVPRGVIDRPCKLIYVTRVHPPDARTMATVSTTVASMATATAGNEDLIVQKMRGAPVVGVRG